MDESKCWGDMHGYLYAFKFDESYIICHLFNCWPQCNVGNIMWRNHSLKYWNILEGEIAVECKGKHKDRGEFSFDIKIHIWSTIY